MFRLAGRVLVVVVSGLCFANPASAQGEATSESNQPAKPDKEYVTLFTGINRSSEVFEAIKKIAPNMKSDGDANNWTKIDIKIKQSGLDTRLRFNHDKSYYTGKKWQFQKLGMYNYFSKFPEAEHKQRTLRLIKRLRFAVATILEPARVKDDARLKLILSVSKEVKAVMFTPGALMDSTGKIIISLDGYSDPKAKVDL